MRMAPSTPASAAPERSKRSPKPTPPRPRLGPDESLRQGGSAARHLGLRGPAAKTRTLDSHASRLRRNLDPEHARYVVNWWGIGYRLVDD
jgi:hypothetical protein